MEFSFSYSYYTLLQLRQSLLLFWFKNITINYTQLIISIILKIIQKESYGLWQFSSKFLNFILEITTRLRNSYKTSHLFLIGRSW